MRSLVWTLFVVTLAAGAAAQEPQWLQDARNREGKLVRDQKVRAPDDWFKSKAPAKLAAEIVKDEDSDYPVNFDIGAGTPIECLVLRESQDPPALLREVSATTLDFVAKSAGEIQRKAIERVDAGAIGGAPYMAVEWLYVAKGAEKPQVGAIHLRYAVKQGVGIYCVKTEVGYTETFKKLFESFVEHFSLKSPPKRPSFSEIVVASVRGMRVGVGTTAVSQDEDGDHKHEETLHMLLPATAEELTATTTYQLEWVRGEDLGLINATSVEIENNEVSTDLALKWSSEKKRWLVSGSISEKRFDAELPEGAEPVTSLEMTRRQREALASGAKAGHVIVGARWTDSSPGELVEAKTTLGEPIDDVSVRATQTFGPITSDAELDRRTGQFLRGRMDMGPAAIDVEQVYVDGKL